MQTLSRPILILAAAVAILLAAAASSMPVSEAASIGRVYGADTFLLQAPVGSIAAHGRPASPATVSVKDFGAVGDGVTDDTKAFNRAYEYLSDAGGRIRVPRSSACYMATEIIRKSRVSLFGDGYASSCIKNLAMPGVSRPLLSAARTADAVTEETIENLTLDGNRNAQVGIPGDGNSVCIYLQGYGDTVLRNLVVKDCYTDGIYVTGSGPLRSISGNRLLIDHVRVSNSRRNNLSIIGGDEITLSASSFNNANGTPPQCGIDIEPDVAGQTSRGIFIRADVTISGNKGSGLSVFNNFQNQPSMNLVIDGSFSGNNVAGIDIISGPPYEIGQIRINGRFRRNGAVTKIAIGLAGVHDVVVGNAQVNQDGTALYADRVSHMEIGAGARLSGTTHDLYLTDHTTAIHLGSRTALAHRSIGGFRGELLGN